MTTTATDTDSDDTRHLRVARSLSWLALMFGLGVSVAANIAAATVGGVGARLLAAVPPVLVVLAAALIERVPIHRMPWWTAGLTYFGLTLILGTSFGTSFEQQHHLLMG